MLTTSFGGLVTDGAQPALRREQVFILIYGYAVLIGEVVFSSSRTSYFGRQLGHIFPLTLCFDCPVGSVSLVVPVTLALVALTLLAVDCSCVRSKLDITFAGFTTRASLKNCLCNWEESRINSSHCLSTFQMMIRAVAGLLRLRRLVYFTTLFITRVIVNRLELLKKKAG